MNKTAYKFIILLGMVSLFADMTYEGARSITGPYLAVLGANAAIVGFVAGFGEFLGFGLRYISGFLADRTHKYWFITIVGYAVNVFAVPLLALAGSWQIAAGLIILERVGKSIRIPARDAMLSHASESVGMGRGFGIHQMFDQIGAMLGPLTVAAVLFFHRDYQFAFAVLFIPAIFAMIMLYFARSRFPNPHELAINLYSENAPVPKKVFTLFLMGSALLALGFSDFPLIAYHFQKSHLLLPILIPVAYGVAMGVDAISAPFIGHLYDKRGLTVLVIAIFITAFFAPLVYLGNAHYAFLGVALWAVGMGVQDSLLRSIVGKMTPAGKRGSAYGIFNLIYGAFWFIGSAASGILYDHNIALLVYFILITQFLAIPFFISVMRK
ncbi:MAG TPA: MFS transporter [Gammaproteobacteria bacterium]|nr:MFS transporter [Gammaproteobacteria bacterium]